MQLGHIADSRTSESQVDFQLGALLIYVFCTVLKSWSKVLFSLSLSL